MLEMDETSVVRAALVHLGASVITGMTGKVEASGRQCGNSG